MRWIALAAAASAALLAAIASGEEAREPGADQVLAEMGGELYEQYCVSCHGSDGKGNGPAAGALKVHPADLTHIAARREGHFPDGEIARFIDGRFAPEAHGSREMPIWGQRLGERVPEAGVSEEIVRGQILVLVEYLRSIQSSD